MYVVLPNNPMKPGEVDADFREERNAATALGFEVRLYRHEALVKGDVARALIGVGPAGGAEAVALHRGWMLTDAQYTLLHNVCLGRGYHLLNDPAAYAQAHYLPAAYPILEGHTPFSVWTEGPDIAPAWDLYQRHLCRGDAIVKDYVKSVKHRWDEACFIPAGSDAARFRRVLEVFLAERDNLFEKGFVLRQFVPLVTDGRDMRGHPVTKESRLFFVDGELLLPLAPAFSPPARRMDVFQDRARRFASRFMTMDVAETAAGDWVVIEVGDGGVSGLPVSLPAEDFYAALRGRLSTA